jgi:flagellar basal body-associated protein FliL
MTSHLDSSNSIAEQPPKSSGSGWLKLGLIAGASALAGGIAAAWWYRKTLTKLREAEQGVPNPEFRNQQDDAAGEG